MDRSLLIVYLTFITNYQFIIVKLFSFSRLKDDPSFLVCMTVLWRENLIVALLIVCPNTCHIFCCVFLVLSSLIRIPRK